MAPIKAGPRLLPTSSYAGAEIVVGIFHSGDGYAPLIGLEDEPNNVSQIAAVFKC